MLFCTFLQCTCVLKEHYVLQPMKMMHEALITMLSCSAQTQLQVDADAIPLRPFMQCELCALYRWCITVIEKDCSSLKQEMSVSGCQLSATWWALLFVLYLHLLESFFCWYISRFLKSQNAITFPSIYLKVSVNLAEGWHFIKASDFGWYIFVTQALRWIQWRCCSLVNAKKKKKKVSWNKDSFCGFKYSSLAACKHGHLSSEWTARFRATAVFTPLAISLAWHQIIATPSLVKPKKHH